MLEVVPTLVFKSRAGSPTEFVYGIRMGSRLAGERHRSANITHFLALFRVTTTLDRVRPLRDQALVPCTHVLLQPSSLLIRDSISCRHSLCVAAIRFVLVSRNLLPYVQKEFLDRGPGL
jgi:hypothetical protein